MLLFIFAISQTTEDQRSQAVIYFSLVFLERDNMFISRGFGRKLFVVVLFWENKVKNNVQVREHYRLLAKKKGISIQLPPCNLITSSFPSACNRFLAGPVRWYVSLTSCGDKTRAICARRRFRTRRSCSSRASVLTGDTSQSSRGKQRATGPSARLHV